MPQRFEDVGLTVEDFYGAAGLCHSIFSSWRQQLGVAGQEVKPVAAKAANGEVAPVSVDLGLLGAAGAAKLPALDRGPSRRWTRANLKQ